MRKLVIYYSFESNTRFIAENIKEEIDADILELKPKKEMISKGFMKYIIGSIDVLMKKKPELLPLGKEPQDYDILFIGTPVWAWSYAPALNTFFSSAELRDKKIALFCCHTGRQGEVFEKMKKTLAGNKVLSQMDFLDPLKSDKDGHAKKAKQWAKIVILTLSS